MLIIVVQQLSWIHNQFDKICSSDYANMSGNVAERFDAKPLTNLWYLILPFFHFKVVHLVRYTLPETITPQHFIDFVHLICTLHIFYKCVRQEAFLASSYNYASPSDRTRKALTEPEALLSTAFSCFY